jgi:hypothetical protein
MDPQQSPEGLLPVVMPHPVTFFAGRVHEVLDEVTMVATAGVSAAAAGAAAVQLARAGARIAALRLRLLDKADRTDIGKESASTTEAWWAQAATIDRSRARRDIRLADWLTTEFHRTEATLAAGRISAAQTEIIVDAVRALPGTVGPEEREKAELHMLELAAQFGPEELKVLGKRLLEVIDPDDADARLAKQLEKEEDAAARRCFLELHDDGKGTTVGRFAIPTLAGDMLTTALNAFASPRRPDGYDRHDTDGKLVTNPVLLGQAFTELIERYPADRIPQSGGIKGLRPRTPPALHRTTQDHPRPRQDLPRRRMRHPRELVPCPPPHPMEPGRPHQHRRRRQPLREAPHHSPRPHLRDRTDSHRTAQVHPHPPIGFAHPTPSSARIGSIAK